MRNRSLIVSKLALIGSLGQAPLCNAFTSSSVCAAANSALGVRFERATSSSFPSSPVRHAATPCKSDRSHQRIHSHSLLSRVGSPRRLFSSGSGDTDAAANIHHINKAEMHEILEDYEAGGRDESMYVVIDVRTSEEVMATGKLSPNVYTLPVQLILQHNVFAIEDEDDFEELCGFAKPSMDETLVFTCAAGIRSVYACQAAAQAGYSNLVNYAGGSNDWFH